MQSKKTDGRLIIALDHSDIATAQILINKVGNACNFYKIGLQLLPIGGMDLAQKLKLEGQRVFLDFKLHDIPQTVKKATQSIVSMDCGDFLTVHGEPPVMHAAVEGRAGSKLRILAVTVLTAYDDAMLAAMGYSMGARDLVLHRVDQAIKAGVDGVIASPLEANAIRARAPDDFLVITPGIRPSGSHANDQKRTSTPVQAIRNGADYIVVGRPITAQTDPMAATLNIIRELQDM